MKRIVLLTALSFSAFVGIAQVTLTGTSYTQNFDALGVSTPTGWSVYTGATATGLGTLKSVTGAPGLPFHIAPDTSACAGLVVGGGFKNYPSANVINPGVNFCPAGSTTVSATYTDRALGVRQVSQTNGTFPGSDGGAAFALEIANTTNRTNLNLTFKLQSLDTSSPRTTTWIVDYGIGASPTSFTPATAVGTMVTGNKVFSNNTITVNFGSALDNKSTPVWIRVAALAGSTGSGNRPSTAIDDFTLTYTNSTAAVYDMTATQQLSFNVLGAATSSNINFGVYCEEAGDYSLAIYDLAGRIIHTQSVQTKGGSESIVVSGLNLTSGMYIVRLTNGNSSAVAKVSVQ
ncbi:MAG: T9SS type A sorting domain-containing protein [Bacteroidota bacterium]